MFDKKNGTFAVVTLSISIAALILASISLVKAPAKTEVALDPSQESADVVVEETEGDIQYILFVGTNDKDTNEPVYAPDECLEHLEEILTRHFYGFTIQEARGGWLNDDGSVAHEYTMVVYLSDTSIDAVHAACDEMITEFNQSSILIQQNTTSTEFYS
ncbi:MAG: DUF3574 domain-containing protein [Clostridiales bacterium]|nr:DUF3574 domain-containing protein [Clostridiales bacterium]